MAGSHRRTASERSVWALGVVIVDVHAQNADELARGGGTSAAFDLPTTAGITEFPVNMPVRTGDHIGIGLPGGSKRALIIAQKADAFVLGPARR